MLHGPGNMNDRCLWCRGKGFIKLMSYGNKRCLNCKGSGKGKDGGDGSNISSRKRPWMIGNNKGVRRPMI
jgi:hypothetical protein